MCYPALATPSPPCCIQRRGPASDLDALAWDFHSARRRSSHTFDAQIGSMKTFKNFVAGKWADAVDGESFENRNPADWNDVIGTFPRRSEERRVGKECRCRRSESN